MTPMILITKIFSPLQVPFTELQQGTQHTSPYQQTDWFPFIFQFGSTQKKNTAKQLNLILLLKERERWQCAEISSDTQSLFGW